MTDKGHQRYDGPVKSTADLFSNSSFSGDILSNESMKKRCTFKTGGNAELLIIPRSNTDIQIARTLCREGEIPLFVLGGGANILVSDKGISGVTLSMEKMKGITRKGNTLICEAGLSVNDLVKKAWEESLSGLEFLQRLPGSVGGALYMNARCYGSEIADVLAWAEILNNNNEVERVPFKREDWDYKKSPFQKEGILILKAAFHLNSGYKDEIKEEMDRIATSRVEKGHFKAPSAGSTFKNNRAHGKPAGRIIDECGLKGLSRGGASVSSWHGNIFINAGGATSKEIWDLIIEVQETVRKKTGFDLEPEVLRVGDWE